MLTAQFFNKRLLKLSLISIIGLFLLFSASALQVNATPADQPAAGINAALFADGPSGYILVQRLNIRSGPGTSYPVLAAAHHQEVVSLTGRNATTTWLQIRQANGQQGWAYAPFIVASAAHLSALPILDGVPPTPIPPPPAEATGYVVAYRLNVRAGPSLHDRRIGVLNQGQVVSLIGRNTTSTWLQIRLPDYSQGWVFARYIQNDVPIHTLPITDGEVPNPLPLPEASGEVTAHKLNVRSGPSLNYGIMGWLYQDQQVRLLGRSHDARWLKVEMTPNDPNYQGWVSARYIQANISVINLPIFQ